QGLNSVLRSAEVRCVPVADGGEGTVDAAVSAGFARHSLQVTGPVSVGVEATWALDGSHEAVVELAQASGIELLDPNRLAGTAATSRAPARYYSPPLNPVPNASSWAWVGRHPPTVEPGCWLDWAWSYMTATVSQSLTVAAICNT